MANPKKLKAVVKDLISLGHKVHKINFSLEKKIPRCKAGQFLHLTLEGFDPTIGYWPESRVFSIASVSEDRKEVSIVYSVKGVYTQKMESKLKVGESVWLKAPYGEFIIPNHIKDGETAVLIAGGTGISPFIPYLTQSKPDTRIQLNYGLRHRSLIIFNKELKQASNNENFSLNLYLEDSTGDKDLDIESKEIDGILSIKSILDNLETTVRAVFFISGPPQMIEAFKEQLIESGINSEKIVIDEWG